MESGYRGSEATMVKGSQRVIRANVVEGNWNEIGEALRGMRGMRGEGVYV